MMAGRRKKKSLRKPGTRFRGQQFKLRGRNPHLFLLQDVFRHLPASWHDHHDLILPPGDWPKLVNVCRWVMKQPLSSSWWLNQPILETYAQSKMDEFLPQFSG